MKNTNDIVWSIYKITNILNRKVYVGQTKNPNVRWSRHKSDARLNKNTSIYLNAAMRKYGENNFIFEIIAQTKLVTEIDDLEIYLINQNNSSNKKFGYNISPGGQSNKIVSVETRIKQSNAAKGRVSWNKGKKCSNETKKMISKANKGNKFRLGYKVSDETKIKLSKINTGKKASQKTLKKMSQSMLGKNKGENNGMFNQKSPNAKLNFEQAILIREKYSSGKISLSQLASEYKVSKKTILNIIKNRIYKNNV